jgi:hypothetical protein
MRLEVIALEALYGVIEQVSRGANEAALIADLDCQLADTT